MIYGNCPLRALDPVFLHIRSLYIIIKGLIIKYAIVLRYSIFMFIKIDHFLAFSPDIFPDSRLDNIYQMFKLLRLVSKSSNWKKYGIMNLRSILVNDGALIDSLTNDVPE